MLPCRALCIQLNLFAVKWLLLLLCCVLQGDVVIYTTTMKYMWFCLILLRFAWTCLPQTGYIHPDEFFQSVEVASGQCKALTGLFLPCVLDIMVCC